MGCPNLDLSVFRGDEFEYTFRFWLNRLPLDVSGYGGMIMQVRLESRIDVVEAPAAAATIDFSQAADGIVVAVIDAADTGTLDPTDRYVYDAQLTTPATTILRGRFIVRSDVSRP